MCAAGHFLIGWLPLQSPVVTDLIHLITPMCLRYKAVSRITLMCAHLWNRLQAERAYSVYTVSTPGFPGAHVFFFCSFLLSSKGWTSCSVVSVIKTDFRNRIQMLLEDALEMHCLLGGEAPFVVLIIGKYFCFRQKPQVSSSSVEKT